MRSVGEAFSFVFRDPDWPVKVLLGALFTALSVVLVGIPVVYGYYIEVLRRSSRNDPNALPDWSDPGIKFITGFKYLVTLFIYSLPVILLMVPLFLYLIFTAALSPHSVTAPMITLPLVILIVMPFSLFISLLLPLITIRFAERERISDGLNIAECLRLFRLCWQDLLLILVMNFLVSIGAAFGLILFIIGVLATSFYAHCVLFHLYGQLASTLRRESPAAAS
jgi:hypothetical protein